MLPDTPIFAFGIGSLGMLWWLGAAATPILIHLWTRRRYREAPWAAMEYLLAAIQKNARRVRIEQWLLLLIRTLIVVCVVLAMSEPYWASLGLKNAGGDRTLRVIVIDGSYSMAYKPSDKSRFERAKELAAQIAADSPEGDAFAVVLMADPPRVVIGTPAFERRDVQEEINNLKVLHGGGDLSATLVKIEELLNQAAKDQRRLARREIYFLTDLGRTTWAADASGPQAASDTQARLKRLKESGVALVVLDLGQPNSENLAVTDLRSQDSYTTLFRDVTYTAHLRNFGHQPHPRKPLEFFVDGRKIKDDAVDLPAGGEATASFSTRFDAPGQHIVEARLGGDLLDIDNHRWLSVPVKESLRVLCVDGTPGGAAYENATDNLRVAIDPDVNRNSNPTIRTQAATESAVSELDLNAYDCVVLSNVGQFTSGEAKILDGYLRHGGSLMFFLGDRVNAERYNRELGGEGGGIRILPARLDQPVANGRYQFNPLGYRHPVMDAFRGNENSGLLQIPIYKYFRVEPRKDSTSKVALAFDTGDPAILEETIHRGRVILCALPASIIIDKESKYPWTYLPKLGSFGPLVQNMLSVAVDHGGDDANVLVGQTIGGELTSAAIGAVTLKTPDGRTEQLRLQAGSGEPRWSYSDTCFSGIYTAELASLSAAAAPAATRRFAVNVDPVESDLAKLDPPELPPEFSVRNDWANLNTSAAVDVTPRDELHKLFLYSLLSLVLSETALAWWFGNRAA